MVMAGRLKGKSSLICMMFGLQLWGGEDMSNENHHLRPLMLPCDLLPNLLIHIAIDDDLDDR